MSSLPDVRDLRYLLAKKLNLLPVGRFTRHENQVSGVTGVWLLPSVSPIVAAAAGGIVAASLPPAHARLTVIFS